MRQPLEQKQTTNAEASRSIDIQVKRYLVWLLDQAQHDRQESVRETHAYADQARRVVDVHDRQVQIFAPFRYHLSALYTLTRPQGVTLVLVGLLVLLLILWNWENTLIAAIALITLGYLVHLALDGLLIAKAMNEQESEDINDTVIAFLHDAPWPLYTILCPLYHEARVVPQFVAAMKTLDYPSAQLQILFLTEEDDLETRATIRALDLPAHFTIVTVPPGEPRTKPRACNYGLMEASGYYTVIYDAEDQPDPLQLKKAVLAFAKHDENLACVQARLNFYNPRQNLLTRWFTAEYSQWFDMMLPGLQKTRLVIPLGGTSNHFVTQTLRALGGWDAFNVTEDCDLGLRMAHFGLKTAILNSTTYEEANPQVKNWIRQRSRWIKGYMQTYLVHIRNPLPSIRKGQWRELFSLQVVIGGKTAVLLANPLVWIMTLLYLIFRPALYNDLFPIIILYMSIFCFIAGNFFYCYTYMISCVRRKQYDLVPWMLLLPIYWVLNSIAAYMAFYELIVRPHYWQKTQHGFHLQNKQVIELSTEQLQDEQQFTRQAASDAALQRSDDLASMYTYAPLTITAPASVEDALHTMVAKRRSALLPSELIELEHNVTIMDPWFTRICWIVVFTSLLAKWFSIHRGKIFDYPDSISHHMLAQQILRGITPAVITRMGGSQLPLAYYSMALPSWLDAIWKANVAGSILEMISFIACTICIFLIGRRLTQNSLASFLGALVFMLNPYILYLQSTSLPIMMSFFVLVMSSYYLLVWAQTEKLSVLIKAGAWTLLATLLTYEGWVLAVILLTMVFCISLYKRYTRPRVMSNLMIYGMLGFIGISTLMLWEWTVLGDPLFFLHVLGPYPGLSPSDMIASFSFYWLLLLNHVGLFLLIIAIPGIMLLFIRYHTWPSILNILLLLIAPWFCFLATIYLGQLDPFGRLAGDLAPQQQIILADLGALLTITTAILITVQSAYFLQKIKIPTLKTAACIVLILLICGQSLWLGTHVLTLQYPGPQQLPQASLMQCTHVHNTACH